MKHDEEVSTAYMRKMEDERILLMQGRELGHAEGLAEGLDRGLQAFIQFNLAQNIPQAHIIENIRKHFRLSEKEAMLYYNKYTSSNSLEL